jgi:hypothetical protein
LRRVSWTRIHASLARLKSLKSMTTWSTSDVTELAISCASPMKSYFKSSGNLN